MISVVVSTLYVIALNDAILVYPSSPIFLMLNTFNDSGYCRVWSELFVCDNAERLKSLEVVSRRLLIAELTVRSTSASSFSTFCSSLVQVDVSCSESFPVVQTVVNGLDSARLTAGIHLSPWASGQIFQVSFVTRQIIHEGDSLLTGIRPEDKITLPTPHKRGLR